MHGSLARSDFGSRRPPCVVLGHLLLWRSTICSYSIGDFVHVASQARVCTSTLQMCSFVSSRSERWRDLRVVCTSSNTARSHSRQQAAIAPASQLPDQSALLRPTTGTIFEGEEGKARLSCKAQLCVRLGRERTGHGPRRSCSRHTSLMPLAARRHSRGRRLCMLQLQGHQLLNEDKGGKIL